MKMNKLINKTKKVLTSFLITGMALSSFTAFPALAATETGEKPDANWTITSDKETVEQGDTFTLSVTIDENIEIKGYTMNIGYEPEKVEFVSGAASPLIERGTCVNNTTQKRVSSSSYTSGTYVVTDGKIMSVTFKAKDDIKDTAAFKLNVIDTFTKNPEDPNNYIYFNPVISGSPLGVKIIAPPTDITELTSKITEAEAIDSSLYTAASYQNLEAAIAAAKEITTENTKDEVAAQVKALDDAIKQLVKAVDKTALKAVIDEAKTYDEALYTPDSYAALTKAVAEAQSVLDADLADNAENQKTVADAAQAVKTAIAALSAKGDQAALAASIQAAEAALAREDVTYIDETKANVQTALNAAKALVGQENATDAEVSAAVKNLNDAVAKLVIAADENAFNAAVAQVREAFKEEVYTTSSWKAVAEALKNADAMAGRLAEGQVPAAEADKVLSDLQNATKSLMEKATKTEDLTKAVEAAKKLDESHYTADSFAVVKEALAAAEKVAGNLNDSTQQQVDTVVTNLNTAVSKLVTVTTDEKTGVVVNGLQPGEGIRVDDKSKDKEAVAGVGEAIKNAGEFANAKETKILFLADITPEVTENADGSFTVTIPLKADQLKYDAYFVGHKGADGSFTWQAVTPDADGKVTFTTKSFSEFTVVGMNRQEESPNTDNNQTSNSGNTGSDNNTKNASGGTINPVTGVPYTEEEIGNGALQAAGMLALMGLCGIAFYRRQRKAEH